ncbi:YcxB family protein [Promicromonospora sp. NPDC050880]|uniref:YcxB family protein n=1 Tax=Promicromonospora sp. NPDC050880 TaxID=3364406 RepID=UPI00378780C1
MTPETHGRRPTAADAAYDFVPVRADYADLLRAMPQMRAVRVLGWCVLGLIAAMIGLSFLLVRDDGAPVADAATLAPLVVLGMLTGIVVLGYAPLGAHAAWRRPANREPVRAVLDDDGFRHEGPSGSQACVWGVASQARETAGAYYLYVPNGLASMIFWLPKRAVPVGEQALVRERIRAHVGRYVIR